MKWLDISGAPKDGSVLLLKTSYGICEGSWTTVNSLICNGTISFFRPSDVVASYDVIDFEAEPTHYMTLDDFNKALE